MSSTNTDSALNALSLFVSAYVVLLGRIKGLKTGARDKAYVDGLKKIICEHLISTGTYKVFFDDDYTWEVLKHLVCKEIRSTRTQIQITDGHYMMLSSAIKCALKKYGQKKTCFFLVDIIDTSDLRDEIKMSIAPAVDTLGSALSAILSQVARDSDSDSDSDSDDSDSDDALFRTQSLINDLMRMFGDQLADGLAKSLHDELGDHEMMRVVCDTNSDDPKYIISNVARILDVDVDSITPIDSFDDTDGVDNLDVAFVNTFHIPKMFDIRFPACLS